MLAVANASRKSHSTGLVQANSNIVHFRVFLLRLKAKVPAQDIKNLKFYSVLPRGPDYLGRKLI